MNSLAPNPIHPIIIPSKIRRPNQGEVASAWDSIDSGTSSITKQQQEGGEGG